MKSCNYLLSIPLNESEIPAAQLNIESKARSNLFPWNGQFSPQFVEVMLRRYAPAGASVLDPFCGSGTVLAESCQLGLTGTGIELNPAAFMLARIYTLAGLTSADRTDLTVSVERKLQTVMPDGWPLMVAVDNLTSYQAVLPPLLAISSEREKVVLEAFIILADFFKGANATKLAKTWEKLRQTIEKLPQTTATIAVHHSDGRYPEGGSKHDLVFTSPPYINVYNYHQQYRASAEALGWDLLHVAKTEIGSNRKNRGNRFLTVTQYCLDLAITLDSLWNATTHDARLIFVMGRESRVRGVPFFNGQIAANLAIEAVGYGLCLRQERVFTNRFGQQIFEDILHLEKGKLRKTSGNVREIARSIAEATLASGLVHAENDEIKNDLMDAINRVHEVKESPLYQHQESKNQLQEENIHGISNPAPRKAARDARQRQTARDRQAAG